ncbi:glutamine-hydrolyzing carbamoyl-phosphate synthase small subunit [Thiotrichales bacterium HSG1]|nr:glutamine-hydrolyzing carbamoyl-phosphate synthase small subunit [Thiotrichales bacterium HSG1]
MKPAALLALADGSLFYGDSIGIDGQCCGEVVFNTSMTGYQEILTDPSYCRQIVTLTYPHIGNVGINIEDEESSQVFVTGLIIRDLPLLESNWRTELSLTDYLKKHKIVGIAGIDTRRLTRILRKKGVQSGCLVTGEKIEVEAAIQAAKNFSGLQGIDLAKEVSVQRSYEWQEGVWSMDETNVPTAQWRVVAYDFGVKRNILRLLVDRGCNVTVVPAQTPASEVLKLKPDGVFLSNGPGDPEPCDYAVAAIKTILNQGIPMFGICLGHQLLGLACGAKTVKMKFGHHGANHPVQEIDSGKVMITSQNHGFALDEKSLPDSLQATHHSLFDGSLQGIRHLGKPAFSFQGHPEASPGPHDVANLFDQFIDLMKNNS